MRLALLVPPAVAAAVALGGCGSSDDGPRGGAAKLAVTASEFAFDPSTLAAKPGKLTITMKNAGKDGHELVVLRTATKADGLKVSGGRVSEKDAIGEIGDTAGGASKSATFDLEAGTYVYVCNIPGHYGKGMRGTLTVR
ncbi:MAG: hypothetical protein QOG56_3035 [Solirubrobacteraceae bacterium]|jgi:plastocyanin|nr:hypothetical protein [Solirubrobacteraceae bacterium]